MLALAYSNVCYSQGGAAVGARIVDEIANLRERGIVVIYSSELLTDEMRAAPGAPAADGVAALQAILRPHGLSVAPGPRDSWLVVRATPPEVPSGEDAVPPRFAVQPPSLEEVVVSASRYSMWRDVATSVAQVDRTQIARTPTLGEDAIRALHGLPGLAGNGLGADFNVRGGASGEAMLFIDGVQLFDPFHLKNFQNLFSSISPSILESMTIFTGAFPAQFGDRMSAVIDMQTLEPTPDATLELGASLFTTSVATGGQFANGRGSWLGSLRRGNLDLLVEAANPEVGTPRYLDAFGKIRYELDDSWSLDAGVFAIDDELALNDDPFARANADYSDSYLWARAAFAGERLAAQFLLSASKLGTARFGVLSDPIMASGTVRERRSLDSNALKADWRYSFNDRHVLGWGAELRDGEAFYDYASALTTGVPIRISPPMLAIASDIDTTLDRNGRNNAIYINLRSRLSPKITTELGLRRDAQSYLDDDQLSPRLNVLLDISERLNLRGSWGRYYQAQRLDELDVGAGIDTFFPAQQSEHYVIGLEYLMPSGTAIRLEAYRKEIEKLTPRSENLFARLSLLPELQPDRVRIAPLTAESTGIELSADGDVGRWRWWASLSRARSYDLFDDSRLARSWEEPWSLKSGVIRDGDVWDLALTTTWHDGWPVGTLELIDGELVASAYNQRRFGQFGSVDLRLSRDFSLEHGTMEFYVSVANLFARDNPCCIDYAIKLDELGSIVGLSLDTDSWLSIVPNVGAVWRFSGRAN